MPPTNQSDYDEWVTLGQRVQRALQIHRLPDTPAVQRAREVLRAALQHEPEHRTDAAAVRYRRRILEQFERAIASEGA